MGSLAQRYKGLDVLLKAMKLLLSEIASEVVVIGDGKHRGELEKLADNLGIRTTCSFWESCRRDGPSAIN